MAFHAGQFPDENVSIPVQKGISINCLGFISRKNEFFYKTEPV
jgi:hypothetical protein